LEQPRSELWTATVSLFRSQLEALEANGKISDVKIEELFDNEIYIGADTGVLSIWLDIASGEGSWNVITNKLDRAEPWFMSADGKVELSGQSMDVPTAVEKLIEKLSTK
jgi:hypothetical protein